MNKVLKIDYPNIKVADSRFSPAIRVIASNLYTTTEKILSDFSGETMMDLVKSDNFFNLAKKAGYSSIKAGDTIINIEEVVEPKFEKEEPVEESVDHGSVLHEDVYFGDVDEVTLEDNLSAATSDEPSFRDFILPDGRFLNAGDYSHINVLYDILGDSGLEAPDSMSDEYEDYLDYLLGVSEDRGWIQIGLDCDYCHIPTKPTEEQYESLLKYLDYAVKEGCDSMEFSIPGSDWGSRHATYSFKEYIPDEIIKKIRKGIAVGRLDEKVDEEFPDPALRAQHYDKHVVNPETDFSFTVDDYKDEIAYESAADEEAATPVRTSEIINKYHDPVVGYQQDNGSIVKYDRRTGGTVVYKPDHHYAPKTGNKIITYYKSRPMTYQKRKMSGRYANDIKEK